MQNKYTHSTLYSVHSDCSAGPHTLRGNHVHTSVHSLQRDGVLASSWFAVSHQEAGFPAALQLSLSLLPTHTAMVPAWRGGGRRGGRENDGRGGRSVTYSTETYGDKSNVKPVIGDDDEREREGEREQEKESVNWHQWRITVRRSDSEVVEKIWVHLLMNKCGVLLLWLLRGSHICKGLIVNQIQGASTSTRIFHKVKTAHETMVRWDEIKVRIEKWHLDFFLKDFRTFQTSEKNGSTKYAMIDYSMNSTSHCNNTWCTC